MGNGFDNIDTWMPMGVHCGNGWRVPHAWYGNENCDGDEPTQQDRGDLVVPHKAVIDIHINPTTQSDFYGSSL